MRPLSLTDFETFKVNFKQLLVSGIVGTVSTAFFAQENIDADDVIAFCLYLKNKKAG